MMNKTDSILVLGSRGMVGSAIVKELGLQGYENILKPNRKELDLLDQREVRSYFTKNKPNVVILAAAKVGGIVANNTFRADFIFENLGIQQNVFESCFKEKVDKLLFLGSSCIYPKSAPQPMTEESLLTSPLEETNEPYAIAKIAGLKMAESFNRQYGCKYTAVMPTNLYGENDNFDLLNSHVIPGMIARLSLAIDNNDPQFKVWGTGNPKREFLYVGDMAKACIHVLKSESRVPSLINIGSGKDIQIKDLAQMIAKKMNYQGEIIFDSSKPDGTMRKLLDISKIMKLGWSPEVSLEDGLDRSIDFFSNIKNIKN